MYWEEIPLPNTGSSVTLFIRETTITKETFTLLFSRLFSSGYSD